MRGAKTRYASNLCGVGQFARGVLISLIAVISTAVAHYSGTGHAPELGTALFAFAITTPICIGLSRVPQSRARLAGAVLTGQVFLHVLFGPGPSTGAEAHHDQLLAHAQPGALLMHVAAFAVTYTAVRRGDALVQILYLLLELSLFRQLPEAALTADYPVHVPSAGAARGPIESCPGEGPNPLRGPPALV